MYIQYKYVLFSLLSLLFCLLYIIKYNVFSPAREVSYTIAQNISVLTKYFSVIYWAELRKSWTNSG